MDNDTFAVYIHDDKGDAPAYKYGGRFSVKNNNLKIEDDPTGLLDDMLGEGELTPMHLRRLSQLTNHSYIKLQSYKETVNKMHRAEDEEESFDFYPNGSNSPQRIKFINGVATLNGHPLSDEELDLLVQHALSGKGIIRFSN